MRLGRVTDTNTEGRDQRRFDEYNPVTKKNHTSNLMHGHQRNRESEVVENPVEKEVTRRERRSIVQCTKYND